MKIRNYLILTTALVIAGCVPSLHPLWTKDTLVYDGAIKGSYQQDDNVWEFVGDPAKKSYALTIHEKDDKVSRLTANLVAVGDARFLDLYPSDDAELGDGDWLKFHLVPAHLFFRVDQTQPNLVLAAMNPDAIEKLLKDNPEMVKHEIVEDDRVVLTDSPEKLQTFVVAGLKIEGFFGKPQELKPVKTDASAAQ